MIKRILWFVAVYHAFILQTMSQDVIWLDPFPVGFNQPVDIENGGDDLLYIVEKAGVIRVLSLEGEVIATPFLDLRSIVNDNGFELGLLGMAFHPAYPDSAYCYVNYTRSDESTVIARYTVTDRFNADPSSALTILVQPQPFSNHNAGDLAFGPDGFLYIGFGDGGNADDPQRNSQNRQTFLGKMLRINVDTGDPYSIPPDNPFAEDDETLDEIWAIGLRNPWRYSFDRETGDMYIADVGQSQREEVNRQPSSSVGGENYGWRCFEGSLPYLQDGCPSPEELTLPAFEYSHQGFNCGGSITGGFVYRGPEYPDLYGLYLMVDYCTGVFRSWNPEDSSSQVILRGEQGTFSTFGEDASGELYVASIGGTIYRVRSTTTSTSEVHALPNLHIYPSPASEYFILDGAGFSHHLAVQINAYNLNGIRHLSRTVQLGERIDITDLQPGTYILYGKQGDKTAVSELVVAR